MAAGDMIELTAAAGDINTSDQLTTASAYGKLFIANGENLKVADFQNTKLATADVGDNPPDRGNILTGGASDAQLVVDYITTLTGACTLYGYRITEETFASGETVTGTDDDGNAISFVLSANEVAPPQWYDWTVYGGDTDNYGTMPTTAYLVSVLSGRLVLNNRDQPHQAPASAAGNPWDFNPYRTTSDRATVIGTGSAGSIGDVIRAFIPLRDGQFIIGCSGSMHVVVDNPAYGGSIVALDRTIGIFDATSWCLDGDGTVYFWGTGGLYRIQRTSMVIENLNDTSLPDIIGDTNASPSTHRVCLGYDPLAFGVKVCITLLSDGSNVNYWYDTKVGGFFPESYSDSHGVYSIHYYNSDVIAQRGLLLGCTDGYIRVHDDSANDDDGTAIDSYVCFGPIQLGEDGRDGTLSAFDLTLSGGATDGSADDSDGVTVQVWSSDVAKTVLELLDAGTSPKLSFSFAGPGRKRGSKKRRGVRGAFAGFKIGNSTADETWGMENVILDGGVPGRRIQ